MHWHAIVRSNRSYRTSNLLERVGVRSSDALQESDALSRSCKADTLLPFGHDDAADTRLVFQPGSAIDIAEEETVRVKEDEESKDYEDHFLPVSMPVSSSGSTTFSYQLALQNRLHNDKLTSQGEYDTSVYKPTFIHDCMMLPGSLANLVGKVRSSITSSRLCFC